MFDPDLFAKIDKPASVVAFDAADAMVTGTDEGSPSPIWPKQPNGYDKIIVENSDGSTGYSGTQDLRDTANAADLAGTVVVRGVASVAFDGTQVKANTWTKNDGSSGLLFSDSRTGNSVADNQASFILLRWIGVPRLRVDRLFGVGR